MNKEKGIIIGILALIVTMMMGYAIFTETITINGTATAKGDFGISITEVAIKEEVGSTGATATITNGGKGMQLVISNLEYPGAYVKVRYKIKNTGTIPALFKSRTMEGISLDEYDALKRIQLSAPLSKLFYEPLEEQEEEFFIGWDSNDTSSSLDEMVNITYNISFMQVGDKSNACNKLETLKGSLSNYIIGFEDKTTIEEMDINGDTFADNGDLTIIQTIINQMECSSN